MFQTDGHIRLTPNMPYFMQIIVFPVQNSTFHHVSQSQNLACLTFRTASDFCWKPSLKLSALPAITGFNFACVEFFDEFCNISNVTLPFYVESARKWTVAKLDVKMLLTLVSCKATSG